MSEPQFIVQVRDLFAGTAGPVHRRVEDLLAGPGQIVRSKLDLIGGVSGMDPANDLGLDRPSYTKLEVGKRYHPDLPSWPPGTNYNFRCGAHELLVVLSRLSAGEIVAASQGLASFGLIIEPPLITLLFHFGGTPVSLGWGDACYSWWMVSPDGRVLPPPLETLTEESRVPLLVNLVEARTGVLVSQRLVTFTPGFSRALLGAIHGQAAGPPVSQADYNRAVNHLHLKYPNPVDLMSHPSGVLRCTGGE
jgi:hypothetical protein